MLLIPYIMYNTNGLLIAIAVIPAVALLLYVYKKDRLEKESPKLLLLLILMGLLATVCAVITEDIGIALLPFVSREGSTAYYVLLYFVVVAFSEEGFKFLFLKLKTWRNPEFNCSFDGVVYAVFVSLGFALFENILYSLSYGLATALLRAVTAIPGHACFGVFMGAFYGAAKKLEAQGQFRASGMFRILSVFVPVVLHGTYDFCCSLEFAGSMVFFIVFIAAMFFVSFKAVKILSAHDEALYGYRRRY